MMELSETDPGLIEKKDQAVVNGEVAVHRRID
jgi:hypothetical protein